MGLGEGGERAEREGGEKGERGGRDRNLAAGGLIGRLLRAERGRLQDLFVLLQVMGPGPR